MSLITCPECGKAVSSEAATCPSCGRPIKPPPIPANKTGLWWGLGCLLAVPAFLTIIAIVGLLAAIAIPSFIKSRSTFHLHACMINLQQIESAKRSWALAYNANSGAEVDVAGVNEALKAGTGSGCPAGGTYIYHQVGVPRSALCTGCSVRLRHARQVLQAGRVHATVCPPRMTRDVWNRANGKDRT